MKTPAILAKWLPGNRYEITEEYNRQSARNIFTSGAYKGVKLGDTGYTKLWEDGDASPAKKANVIVCKNELLGDLLNS